MSTPDQDAYVNIVFGVDPQTYPAAGYSLAASEAASPSPSLPASAPASSPASSPAPASASSPASAPDDGPDLVQGDTSGTTPAGFSKTPEQVEKEVTDKYGKDIPKAQLANPASKVTNFQDDKAFTDDLKKRHPNLESQGIDPSSVVGESYEGKIFINKDKADVGTAYHEQLHHYSNSKFIEQFSKINGVKFNEGVTEYFTRKMYSGSRAGHYDSEEAVAEAVAKKIGEDTLKKAYFQGDDDAMKKVKDALAGP
jgi:hypothetical protein